MNRIVIRFEYGAFPIWIYNPSGELIDNDIPKEISGTEIAKKAETLQDEFNSLYVDNGVEFFYKGFKTEDGKRRFISSVHYLEEKLREILSNSFQVENFNSDKLA